MVLTLKAPITTAADDIHKYFFIVYQRKKNLMFQVNPLLEDSDNKKQAFFLRNIKFKKLKCRLLQFLSGALRVNKGTYCSFNR